jgi:hypothetical protein
MATSLERYAEAFRLQKEGKTGEAESLFREILAQFPLSPESGYSKVQLDKIVSDREETARRLVEQEKQEKAEKEKREREEREKREKEALEAEERERKGKEKRDLEEKRRIEKELREKEKLERELAALRQKEKDEEMKKTSTATFAAILREREEYERRELEEMKKRGREAAEEAEKDIGPDEESGILQVQVQKKYSRRTKVIKRFAALSIVALCLSAVALILFIVSLAVISRQNGRLEYQEIALKAGLSAMGGDDRDFMRNIMEAKSAGRGKNLPYFMMVEYYLKKGKKDLAYKELRDCPQFDAEYKGYVEKVKNFNTSVPAPVK